MENDATRKNRQTLAPAVEEYREGVNNGDDEKDVAHRVAEKYGVTQKDLRERAEAGA